MYEIEYAGRYHEATTLNAALDWAKQLVVAGVLGRKRDSPCREGSPSFTGFP